MLSQESPADSRGLMDASCSQTCSVRSNRTPHASEEAGDTRHMDAAIAGLVGASIGATAGVIAAWIQRGEQHRRWA